MHDARVPLRNKNDVNGALGMAHWAHWAAAREAAQQWRTRGLVAGSRTLLQATESAVLCPDETRARTRSEVLS